jgi:hypothetical protein
MQQPRQEEILANQMENMLTFSMSSNPNWEFGGAEAE